MFGLFKNKFLEANRLPADREKYLGFGSILLSINHNSDYKPYEEIMLIEDQYKPVSAQILDQFWDITDGASARATIDHLLQHGTRESETPAFVAFKEGDANAIRPDFKEEFKRLQAIEKNYKLNLDDAKACRSLMGWDLERAAFLARLSQHVGYIPEAEAWQILIERIKPMAQASFKTWSEYGISFVEGRTFCYGGDAAKGALGVWLMLIDKKDKSVWNKYPLASI